MSGPTTDAPPLVRRGLELGLVGVALIWGFTFITVKKALEHVPVFEFLALRFWLAAIVLGLVFRRQVAGLGRAGWRAGVLIGLALFVGYVFQSVGLQYTRASNAGFVTGLFVVIAPLLSTVFLHRRPSPGVVAGIVLATVGLGLLSITDAGGFRRGDLIVLGAAFFFAVHIVLLGRFAPEHSPAGLAVVQILVAAALSTVLTVVAEDPVAPTHGDVVSGVLITGILASAAAFLIQSTAQRYVSPSRTAVILVTEPAFAGLFGVVVLGEALALRGWLGAGLILAGMLVAELAPHRGDDP